MISINPKKILIPTDFSEISLRAIKHGVAIAKLFKGEIILLHVQKKADLIDIILPALRVADTHAITNFVKHKLEGLAFKLREEHDVKITAVVKFGNIPSQIYKFAEENGVNLIVMGTHGSDSTGDFLLGTNSYRVLNRSGIPVITVREDIGHGGFSNILIPIDSSEHSRQKVNSAIKIAEKFGARLHVLGLLGKHEDEYEYKLNVILPQIKKLAGKKHVLCSAEIDRASNLTEKTLEYAEKVNADLIIIMSDENEGVSGFMFGNYTYQLINQSRIPVLSIQPEEHPENSEQAVIGGMWQK
jgi:nucleotide-binding universal stress UspA family protein